MNPLLLQLCRQLLVRFRFTNLYQCKRLYRLSLAIQPSLRTYQAVAGITINSSYNSNNHQTSFKDPYPNVTMVTLLGVGLLMCSNRNEDKNTCRRFLQAVKNNERSSVRSFLKSGVDVNCRHPLGWSALHIAVMNGNWEMLKLLVKEGADVNVKDEFSSASRVAHQERVHSSRVAFLRDQEFNSQISHYVSYSGFTPLHYAIVVDDIEMVKFLLENGADPTIENNRGFKPQNYCTNESIKALLEEYTVKAEERKLREQLEERRKYPLEDRLRENIAGQDGAIVAAAGAIRRREMGWGDDDHPMVFLFLGSSGLGKTELAKQIAKYIHKDKKEGFIRLDMSEYQEKHEVAKLIGAPPCYIGYDQGGQLTVRLSECPSGSGWCYLHVFLREEPTESLTVSIAKSATTLFLKMPQLKMLSPPPEQPPPPPLAPAVPPAPVPVAIPPPPAPAAIPPVGPILQPFSISSAATELSSTLPLSSSISTQALASGLSDITASPLSHRISPSNSTPLFSTTSQSLTPTPLNGGSSGSSLTNQISAPSLPQLTQLPATYQLQQLQQLQQQAATTQVSPAAMLQYFVNARAQTQNLFSSPQTPFNMMYFSPYSPYRASGPAAQMPRLNPLQFPTTTNYWTRAPNLTGLSGGMKPSQSMPSLSSLAPAPGASQPGQQVNLLPKLSPQPQGQLQRSVSPQATGIVVSSSS